MMFPIQRTNQTDVKILKHSKLRKWKVDFKIYKRKTKYMTSYTEFKKLH